MDAPTTLRAAAALLLNSGELWEQQAQQVKSTAFAGMPAPAAQIQADKLSCCQNGWMDGWKILDLISS